MEGLQQLVAESLARTGFELPEVRHTEEAMASEPTSSVETRLAASPDRRSKTLRPAPLPAGF